jgi:hypothetical protein
MSTSITPWLNEAFVPPANPADLKALHKFQSDMVAAHPLPPGQFRAVSHESVRQFLTPGADVLIVIYRLGWLRLLQEWSEARPQEFPWIHDGKVYDAVFEALAILPMTGIPNEGLPGPPFDMDELLRLIKEAAA